MTSRWANQQLIKVTLVQTEIENLKAQICALGGEITEDNSKEIAASIDAGCEMVSVSGLRDVCVLSQHPEPRGI